MTGTNCDLFTHKYSRSYLNHLVVGVVLRGCAVLNCVSRVAIDRDLCLVSAMC
jgi:hypothetical protein